METERILRQFSWRFLLVRVLVNAFALAGTAAFLPKIYFVDKTISSWLLMALMLGVLNALLKPILQFLTLPFIFITYGLVVVFVNALLLWLLAFLFPNRFAVDSLFWLLVGGLVFGLLSSFLESLLGLTMPIVPDEPPELRSQVEERAHRVEWLAGTRLGTVPSTQVASEGPGDLGAAAAEQNSAEMGERRSPAAEIPEGPSVSDASKVTPDPDAPAEKSESDIPEDSGSEPETQDAPEEDQL